jgi:hypothetical protein
MATEETRGGNGRAVEEGRTAPMWCLASGEAAVSSSPAQAAGLISRNLTYPDRSIPKW